MGILVDMHAHTAKIIAETGFKEGARGGRERPALVERAKTPL
jgi:hypothetical protein